MRSLPLPVVAVLALTACSSGPSAPSGPDRFLEGRWSGTLTISRPGRPDTTGTAVWTFTPIPQAPSSYQATIQITHAWLPISTIATTQLLAPGTPPSQISTHGDYSSPRGCRGIFGSFGIADRQSIDASFHGVDCGSDSTFDGRVRLSR